jgi:putative ABC transport system permease protein
MTLRDLRLRVRALFNRDVVERELSEEMAFHLEMQTRKHIDAGCDPEEARLRAQREFGNTELAKEDSRDTRGVHVIEALGQDTRFGIRLLRRSPVFALVSIVAIGIAIGINAGFFTLIDAFVWRPIPVLRPERLVRVHLRYRRGGSLLVSYPEARAIALNATTIEDVMPAARCFAVAFRASENEPTIPATPGCVSGNYFNALGGTAARGRTLLATDDKASEGPVVVISQNFWIRAFARASDIVGRDILVNGTHVTVAGVISPSFIGAVPIIPDFWMTLTTANHLGAIAGNLDDRANRFIDLWARVRPGVSYARAEAELSGLLADPAAPDRPDAPRVMAAELKPNSSLIPGNWRTMLMLAPAILVVALVLVIACANLATLTLSRALARQREIAVRLAMGASRNRVVRQLLTEGLIIALFGATLGLLLSRWTITIVSREYFAWIPSSFGTIAIDLSPSWRVLAYTIGLAGVAVMTFGLIPALQVTSQSLTAALKGEDTALGTRIRRSRFRDTLVAAQVAASFVLLVASATLIASLRSFGSEPGLDTNHVSVATLGLSAPGRVAPRLSASRDTFAARVARLDGVVATARALRPPYTNWFPYLSVATSDASGYRRLQHNVVTPGYFALLHQNIHAGRDFSSVDSASGAAVAIITSTTARQLWPDSSALDRPLRIAAARDEPDRIVRIIGIAADAHSGMVWDDDTNGYIYLLASRRDFADNAMPLLVRGSATAASLPRDVANVARQIDATEAISIEPAIAARQSMLTPIRYGTWITTVVGAFGLGLALIGLYGVVAFAVVQRRRDLAIHIAMGASAYDVIRVVLDRELRLVLVGLATGMLLSVAEVKLIAAWVIPLASLGVIDFLVLSALLFVVALAASLIPARTSLRVAPILVLRQD